MKEFYTLIIPLETENIKNYIVSQLREVITTDRLPRSAGALGIDPYKVFQLSTKRGVVVNYSSFEEDEDLMLSIPTKLIPASANEWRTVDIATLRIRLESLDKDDFISKFADLDVVTLSPYGGLLTEELSQVDHSTLELFRVKSKEDQDSVRDTELLQLPIVKALFLIAKYATNEAVVDTFVNMLLMRLGFANG